jgi:hypothetical protein
VAVAMLASANSTNSLGKQAPATTVLIYIMLWERHLCSLI